jgi:hypothetical protein
VSYAGGQAGSRGASRAQGPWRAREVCRVRLRSATRVSWGWVSHAPPAGDPSSCPDQTVNRNTANSASDVMRRGQFSSLPRVGVRPLEDHPRTFVPRGSASNPTPHSRHPRVSAYAVAVVSGVRLTSRGSSPHDSYPDLPATKPGPVAVFAVTGSVMTGHCRIEDPSASSRSRTVTGKARGFVHESADNDFAETERVPFRNRYGSERPCGRPERLVERAPFPRVHRRGKGPSSEATERNVHANTWRAAGCWGTGNADLFDPQNGKRREGRPTTTRTGRLHASTRAPHSRARRAIREGAPPPPRGSSRSSFVRSDAQPCTTDDGTVLQRIRSEALRDVGVSTTEVDVTVADGDREPARRGGQCNARRRPRGSRATRSRLFVTSTR